MNNMITTDLYVKAITNGFVVDLSIRDIEKDKWDTQSVYFADWDDVISYFENNKPEIA